MFEQKQNPCRFRAASDWWRGLNGSFSSRQGPCSNGWNPFSGFWLSLLTSRSFTGFTTCGRNCVLLRRTKIPNPKLQIPNKSQTPIPNDLDFFCPNFSIWILDSYVLKSENFLLTFLNIPQ